MSMDPAAEVEASATPCPRCGNSQPLRPDSSRVDEIDGEYFWDALIPGDALAGAHPGGRGR